MQLSVPFPLDRRDKLIAVTLTAVVLAAGYWWMVTGVCGIYHDDAVYVATAKALADGQGYRLINLPGAPLQTKYPILYPAILAFIWKLWPSFPDNLLAMQAFSLLAGGAVAGLAYLYLVRFNYCSRGAALVGGLLGATSINYLYFSTLTLSEMPFALLLLAGLWTLEEQARAPRASKIRQFFLGILLALPFMCRTIGISLAPVGLFVLYRQRRPVVWVAGGAAVLIFSWLFWTQMAAFYFPGDRITGYYTDYLSWWYENWFSFFGRILANNLFLLLVSTGYMGLPGLEGTLGLADSTILSIGYYIIGIATWIIIVRNAIRGQFLPLYLVSYLFIVILWPWPPFRFLAPIVPFLLAYLISGITATAKRLAFVPRIRTVLAIGMGILLAANLGLVLIRGKTHLQTRYPTLTQAAPLVSWVSFEEVFKWLKMHTSPNETIASGFDTMIYLYTGRRGVRPFVGRPAPLFYGNASRSLGTPEDLLQVLGAYGARYLVCTPMLGFGEGRPFKDLLNNLQREYPGALRPVFVGEDPRFVIFAIGSQ